jgi:hypothetical protein
MGEKSGPENVRISDTKVKPTLAQAVETSAVILTPATNKANHE